MTGDGSADQRSERSERSERSGEPARGDDALPDSGSIGGPRSSRGVWIRLGVFVGILAAAVAVTAAAGLPDPEQLRAEIAAAGLVGVAMFVLLYAAAALAPLPKNVLAAVAGLLFGLALGVVVVFLGALLGAMVAFVLGRTLGRAAVERLTGARVTRVDELLRRHGLVSMLAVRLVPVVPFTAINYAAGLTAVRTRDYVLGTALGIVPGTVAYVAVGAYGTSPRSWPFVVAVLALVGLTVGGIALARRTRRPGKQGRFTLRCRDSDG